jgi:hypothetical protein
MRVDGAGQDVVAACVEDLLAVGLGEAAADGGDDAVGDQDICIFEDTVLGDDVPVANEQCSRNGRSPS